MSGLEYKWILCSALPGFELADPLRESFHFAMEAGIADHIWEISELLA
jgi:hypothetical protein